MVAASPRALRATLDLLGAGDLDIAEARTAVRRAIDAGAGMVDRAYTALRDAAWRTIAARDVSDDLGQWYDLQMHAAALARTAERPDLAERLTTLAELTAQTGRFADRQPLDDVLGRKHVADILLELAAHGGTARRAVVAEATGLADANLSRVLALLSVHNLTRRIRSGKEAVLSLTDAGRLAAARLGGETTETSSSPTSYAWWDEVDFPVALWAPDGNAIGSNAAFRALAEGAGCIGSSALDYPCWSDWLSLTTRDEQPSHRRNARELQLGDDLWVDYLEQRLPDGRRLAILADISPQRQAQMKLVNMIRTKEQIIAKLRQELATTEAKRAEAAARAEENERRLLTLTVAVDQLRAELVGGTATLGRRLRSCIDMLAPSARYYKSLNIVDQQVSAIKHVIQYFMAVPNGAAGGLPASRNDLVEPAQLVRESVELVQSLHKPEIKVIAADLPPVRARSNALRAAIGQAMLAHVREADAKHFIVTTSIQDNKFVFLMMSEHMGGPAPVLSYEDYREASSEHIIFGCGYGSSRDWATSVGGDLFAGEIEDQTFVKMEFPVKPAAAPRRRLAVIEQNS